MNCDVVMPDGVKQVEVSNSRSSPFHKTTKKNKNPYDDQTMYTIIICYDNVA